MRVGIIIQARMGSTRLPSKVTKPLPFGSTTSLIVQIIRRAKSVKNADIVILATSTKENDDYLEQHLLEEDVAVFRGSENDVLNRFNKAAEKHNLDHVVRLTGDNPCIDPRIIESTIEDHLAKNASYTYTKGLPIGMNVEIVKSEALQTSEQKANSDLAREHVTSFIRNNPALYKLNFIKTESTDYLDTRLTVDTKEDYIAMCCIYEILYSKNKSFGLKELKNLTKTHAYIFDINSQVRQKKQFESQDEELYDAIDLLERQDMSNAAIILRNHLAG